MITQNIYLCYAVLSFFICSPANTGAEGLKRIWQSRLRLLVKPDSPFVLPQQLSPWKEKYFSYTKHIFCIRITYCLLKNEDENVGYNGCFWFPNSLNSKFKVKYLLCF